MIHQFLTKLAATDGNVTVKDGLVWFEDGTSFDLGEHFHPHYGVKIDRFPLCHTGENPKGYTAEASRTGDYHPSTGESIYEEVRIGVFVGNGDECKADVLVGLTEKGEPRVLISAGGDGDQQKIAVYPMRPVDQAMTKWNE